MAQENDDDGIVLDRKVCAFARAGESRRPPAASRTYPSWRVFARTKWSWLRRLRVPFFETGVGVMSEMGDCRFHLNAQFYTKQRSNRAAHVRGRCAVRGARPISAGSGQMANNK